MNPRAWALAGVFSVGCASAQVGVDRYSEARGGGDASTVSEASVASSETAWLTAHLADDPDPAHPGESDAVRRLAQQGGVGVRAAAEVFRVGDARRAPFARRVLERVARRQCRRDTAATARQLRALVYGEGVVLDGGAPWPADDARWPVDAVERVRAWGDRGAPCETASVDGGAGETLDAASPDDVTTAARETAR